MYPLTNAQKALFQGFSRQVAVISCGSLRITEADLEGVTIDRYVDAKPDKLEIGTAIAAQATFTVRNTSGAYAPADFLGKTFLISIGTADWTQASPSVTYVPMGYYVIDDVRVNGRKLVVTGLDYMVKFDRAWDWADIQAFPVTVGNLVTTIASVCGVSFTAPSPTPLNWNYNVTSLTGDGITYRMVLQWCAFLMGKSAYIDRDGSLKFGWHNKTLTSNRYDTTTANRFSGTIGDNQLRVGGIQYQNNANIDHQYKVSDYGDEFDYCLEYAGCGILTDSDAPTVVTSILNAVKYFKHYPSSEVTLPAPWVDPFDDTTYTPDGGSALRTVCSHMTFRMNANMSLSGDGMYATSKTKATTRATQVAIRQASQEATKYITTITGRDGVCVHDADDYDNYLNLNGNSLDVYVNGTKRASYSDEVVLGWEQDSHVSVTEDGLDVYTVSSRLAFPYDILHSFHIGNDGDTSGGADVENPPCMKFGNIPDPLPTMGAYSVAFNATATGGYSFATSGTASGTRSVSLGGTADGNYSVSMGSGNASSPYQVAIGKHNVIDSSGTYAFIIGNGTEAPGPSGSTITRSNAFTVDWSGNATAQGKFLTSHTGVGGNAGVVVSSGAAADVAVGVRRTDTNYGVELAVGAGGSNRGIYDRGSAGSVDWMIYMDSSNHVNVPNLYVNGDQVKALKYYDDPTAKNYTVSSNRYVAITRPSALSGKTVVSIGVVAWTSNSNAFWVMPYTSSNTSNFYLIAANNTTVNGLRLRYWYLD